MNKQEQFYYEKINKEKELRETALENAKKLRQSLQLVIDSAKIPNVHLDAEMSDFITEQINKGYEQETQYPILKELRHQKYCMNSNCCISYGRITSLPITPEQFPQCQPCLQENSSNSDSDRHNNYLRQLNIWRLIQEAHAKEQESMIDQLFVDSQFNYDPRAKDKLKVHMFYESMKMLCGRALRTNSSEKAMSDKSSLS